MKGIIECPKCGEEQEKTIPEKACLAFFRCVGCEKIIRAKKECCIFCEYSDTNCPHNR